MNVALAKAIIDSGKKKKTIARLARMEPWQLSKMIHSNKRPTDKQRDRLAALLGKSQTELFSEASL